MNLRYILHYICDLCDNKFNLKSELKTYIDAKHDKHWKPPLHPPSDLSQSISSCSLSLKNIKYVERIKYRSIQINIEALQPVELTFLLCPSPLHCSHSCKSPTRATALQICFKLYRYICSTLALQIYLFTNLYFFEMCTTRKNENSPLGSAQLTQAHAPDNPTTGETWRYKLNMICALKMSWHNQKFLVVDGISRRMRYPKVSSGNFPSRVGSESRSKSKLSLSAECLGWQWQW